MWFTSQDFTLKLLVSESIKDDVNFTVSGRETSPFPNNVHHRVGLRWYVVCWSDIWGDNKAALHRFHWAGWSPMIITKKNFTLFFDSHTRNLLQRQFVRSMSLEMLFSPCQFSSLVLKSSAKVCQNFNHRETLAVNQFTLRHSALRLVRVLTSRWTLFSMLGLKMWWWYFKQKKKKTWPVTRLEKTSVQWCSWFRTLKFPSRQCSRIWSPRWLMFSHKLLQMVRSVPWGVISLSSQ